MPAKMIKKRYITLIEIMIVMFLIALITGVIAYNYRGSLEEGKAFKTRMAIDKLETTLNLIVADDPSKLEHIDNDWERYVRSSPIVHNADALIYDGWGQKYEVSAQDGVIKVRSQKLIDYENSTKSK